MSVYTKHAVDLAKLIDRLPYKALIEVARQFVEMNSEGERNMKDKYGMANTLADWTEAVLEEAEIDARVAANKAAA